MNASSELFVKPQIWHAGLISVRKNHLFWCVFLGREKSQFSLLTKTWFFQKVELWDVLFLALKKKMFFKIVLKRERRPASVRNIIKTHSAGEEISAIHSGSLRWYRWNHIPFWWFLCIAAIWMYFPFHFSILLPDLSLFKKVSLFLFQNGHKGGAVCEGYHNWLDDWRGWKFVRMDRRR